MVTFDKTLGNMLTCTEVSKLGQWKLMSPHVQFVLDNINQMDKNIDVFWFFIYARTLIYAVNLCFASKKKDSTMNDLFLKIYGDEFQP